MALPMPPVPPVTNAVRGFIAKAPSSQRDADTGAPCMYTATP
jgi:hypothetical protein